MRHRADATAPPHSGAAGGDFISLGDATASDAQRSLQRLKPQLSVAWWNPDAFKIGLCAAPPVGQPHALLSLCNSTAFAPLLQGLLARFDKLYSRRAHLHHFTQYMDAARIDEARDALAALAAEYCELHGQPPPPEAEALMEQLVPLPAGWGEAGARRRSLGGLR
mmetsp:Transcript_26925/g.85653  ORF Transcript_26925/g.85653 Transcript_26925/m.85653 type:complete len:165 (-) Transcript_26925:47-541(-)